MLKWEFWTSLRKFLEIVEMMAQEMEMVAQKVAQ